MPVSTSQHRYLAGSPFTRAKSVTPSDTVDLPSGVCRALYVGGAGTVTVITSEDDTVTFTGIPVGTVFPIAATRVKVAGTTATLLVALY